MLRQLLYPLLLPAIVATVWLHAWAVKQEPGHEQMAPTLHPALAGDGSARGMPVRAPGYGFRADDGFAGLDFDDHAGE